MRLILLHTAVMLLVAAQTTLAQSYTADIHTYGAHGQEQLRDMTPTADGGYILVGGIGTVSAGSSDIYLMKLDSALDIEWSKIIGGTNVDWGEAVKQLSDGGYAIAGYTNSYGAGGYDGQLIRTNSIGEVLWQRTYGGSDWDLVYDMTVLPDGSFVLVGETYSFGNGATDWYVIRTDANGVEQWHHTLGGAGVEVARAVIAVADGRIAVVGEASHTGAGMADIFLAFYNSDGDTLSTHTFGGAFDDSGYGIDTTSVHGFLLVGSTESFGGDGRNYAIIKTDSLANEIFFRTQNGGGDDVAVDIKEFPNRDLAVLMHSNSFGIGGYGFWVFRTDNFAWTSGGPTMGGNSDEEARTLYLTDDNHVILGGSTESYGAGFSDFCVIQLEDSIVNSDHTINIYPVTDAQTDTTLLTQINEPLEVSTRVRIVPNPIDQTARISWPDQPIGSTSMLLRIYDGGGRLVRSAVVDGMHPVVHRNGLPAGSYYGVLTTKSTDQQVFQLIFR